MSVRNLTLKPEGISTREGDDGSLELRGIAVPWDEKITYAGIEESFARGSIDAASVVGIPLLWSHDRSEPIGALTEAEDADDGLQIAAVVQPTTRGRDAITLLRSGVRLGLSIGFEPVDTTATATGVRYLRANVVELSTTPLPAYSRAKVASVRTEEEGKESIVDATETREVATVDLQPLTERLDKIEARMIEDRDPQPVQPLHVRERFASMVRAYGADRSKISTRADMVSADNAGLTDTARTSQELIDYFDSERYFASHVVGIPFPESGIVHTLPTKTQNSLVGQAAEKAAAPSQAIQTDVDTYTGVWYKGYLDISYELIRTSSPGAVQIAVDDMLAQAAYESELEFVAAVEAASTLGSPLDFTDYGTLVATARAAVRAVRTAAGRGTPKIALTSDSFDSLIGLTDGDGRRILSTVGPTNADGSASLVAEEVGLGGILFFESPNSTVDVAYNDNSLKRSELPPLQLSADNVPLVGRDVAVIGNIMAIPRVAAGVIRLAAA